MYAYNDSLSTLNTRIYPRWRNTALHNPAFSPAVKIGLRHPDPVVETSSLSSVTPPEVWYKSSIPEESIDSGWLSALQLEAITYAAQVLPPSSSKASYKFVPVLKPTKTETEDKFLPQIL